MAIQQITKERMASTDHYRQQVNVDKGLVAFGYNALAGYLSRAVMAHIRNQMTAALERELEHELRVAIEGKPGFSEYLSLYLRQYVAPDLQERAVALWRRAGWQG